MKELTLSPDNLSFLFPTPAYGSYRVTRDLGDGRAGRTCLAEDPSGRLAVVRGFDVSLPEGGREALAGFLNQLVELGLEHPSLSDPLTSGETDGTLWVAHRYLPGVPLDEGGAPAPLSAEVVARLLEPVAAALDHAASAGVVHGDLTPRDVICRDGRGALAGIGIVQALGAAGLALTGLAPWASPQRRAGALPTHADDVYALAAIAASLLGVREPMEAAVTADVAAARGATAHGGGDAAGQGETDAQLPVPTRVLAVLARGLATEPQDRPVSALSFTALLFTAASAAAHRVGQAGGEAAPAEFRDDPQPREERWDEQRDEQWDERDPLGLSLALAPEPSGLPDAELSLTLDPEPAGWDELESPPPAGSAASEPSWELPVSEDPPPFMMADTGVAPVTDAIDVTDVTTYAPVSDGPAPPLEAEGREWPLVPRSAVTSEPPPAQAPFPASTRASRWPGVVAALLIGIAVGLGAGYGLWHDTSAPASARTAPPATAVPDAGADRSAPAAALQEPPALPTDGRDAQPPSLPAAPDTSSSRGTNRSPTSGRSARTGTLVVRTVPDGARVLVDGDARGRSPLTLQDVRPGTHTVTVERDGYVTERRRVTVRSQQTGGSLQFRLRREPPAAAVTPAASGRLQVESRPTGARVFLDGTLVGTTPLVLSDVRPGVHTVRLELDGYRSWTSPAEVTPGGRDRVAASLDR